MSLTLNQKLVTFFTLFSALGHIMYSYGWDTDILGINLGYWFVLNGIGFCGFLYFLYFSDRFEEKKEVIRYLLAGWTVGSIIAWALFHTASARYNTLLDASLINKFDEVFLLIFLYLDKREITSKNSIITTNNKLVAS